MSRSIRRLRRAELPADTATLARYLIGKILVHDEPAGRTSGRIVETEAYVVGDAAGHAYRGETPRNRSLFLERGHAYVYFIYGCWYAVNVSGESAGVGGGVLLRAIEPLEGIALMRRRRGLPDAPEWRLCCGPGALCRALSITRAENGADLVRGPLRIVDAPPVPAARLARTARIGIAYAGADAARPWRFLVRGSPAVSGPRAS